MRRRVISDEQIVDMGVQLAADAVAELWRASTQEIELRRAREEKRVELAAMRGTVMATRELFASMIDVSPKFVSRLVRRGLPAVGSGRALRIDVARATEWIRSNPNLFAKAKPRKVLTIDEEARRNAQRDATRDRSGR